VLAIARDSLDARLAPVVWAQVRERLAEDVRGLLTAILAGQAQEPRLIARILDTDDVDPREDMLVGQHGAFLTAEMLSAGPDDRPLLSNGQVLGLYAGAVLDRQGAREAWDRLHQPAGTHTIDVPSRTGKTMVSIASEGYAGAVSFANTRLIPGQDRSDETVTGINAEFILFRIQLQHRDGRTRWQPTMALVGLDNLYGDHNPRGMVITNYGSSFHIKTEAPDEQSADPARRRR
jgi:hypothetical protein